MTNNLRDKLNALIGEENTEKMFSYGLDKLVDISELTPENIDFAQDFFENANFDRISEYIREDFTFLDTVKKFYDVQLPLDTVIGGAQRKIILDRKFSFDVKKKIVDVLNSLDEPEESERFFSILDLMSDDNEFLMAKISLKEIILSDKLYKKVLSDINNLPAAVNIVKYNMHNFKKELSFQNLSWLVNILMALPMESQNLVRIWINNIKSDEDCKKLECILISVINCKKLTDDVSCKKYSVSEAIEIYNDIKSKVHNENLSSKNLNNAFSIIMMLNEADNFNEKRLTTAINLISFISDDREFSEIKFFIEILSSFEELPDIMKENNFSLTEVLPVMLKIYFMSAQCILKRDFSFDSIRQIVKILEKCNRDDKKIAAVLELTEKIDSDYQFNYCKEFLLKLSQNKKMMKQIQSKKISLLDQIEKLYIEYFKVSSVSLYTLKIVKVARFSFKIVEQMDRLIEKKSPNFRQVTANLILKLNDDNEFIFTKHFLSEVELLNGYEQTSDLLTDVKMYYKMVLKIEDCDSNKLRVLENTHLSFESISDAVSLLLLEKNEECANKVSNLISIINDDNEYKILRPFFYKIIEFDNIFSGKRKILSAFYDIIYETADKLKVRKIFNNKFLSLSCKSKSMDYLKKILDSAERDALASLICIIKSDDEYDKIYTYFDNLRAIKNLSSVIENYSITPEQIIQICKLGIDKIWAKNVISFDKLKKLAMYLVNCDREKISGVNALCGLIETEEQFDIIFPYLDDLLKDNKILLAIAKEEITLSAICNLYKIGARNIFLNEHISFIVINMTEKILAAVKEKNRRDYIINVISNLSSDVDFVYIKEFLISGSIEKSDKPYHELARNFYIEKLSDKYAKKYKDISSKITRLANDYKFSYTILVQMAKLLNNHKNEKERTAIFNKLMMFRNDNDFIENASSIENLKSDLPEDDKKSFSTRMKKAAENADAVNNEIDQNSGGGMINDPSLMFDDDNLVVNIVDNNVILQFKDKKLVIMTNEVIVTKDKTMRGKFTALSIKINEEIDTNLQFFGSPLNYFSEFRDYLNEHGDSASIEDDEDNGEVYSCLITLKGLEELINEHENFIAERAD